jgi:hypothetical protein
VQDGEKTKALTRQKTAVHIDSARRDGGGTCWSRLLHVKYKQQSFCSGISLTNQITKILDINRSHQLTSLPAATRAADCQACVVPTRPGYHEALFARGCFQGQCLRGIGTLCVLIKGAGNQRRDDCHERWFLRALYGAVARLAICRAHNDGRAVNTVRVSENILSDLHAIRHKTEHNQFKGMNEPTKAVFEKRSTHTW